MGTVREVLFGKVDLDTMTTAIVLGLNPAETVFRFVTGSANAQALNDASVACIEVGGSGRTEKNNFDHHAPPSLAGKTINLSACAQALERLARLVRYVDELDRGARRAEDGDGTFPSLAQLISGMLLCVKKPEERMTRGMEILKEVLQSGIDPYGCMEPILATIPEAKIWTSAKRKHDALFVEVCASAQWFTTASGKKLAVVETTWIGAPGALYGQGAEVVVCLNPAMECGPTTIRKFTIAANNNSVLPALQELNKLEQGWGGPSHGTIGGSPQGVSSQLTAESVVRVVQESL